jgi:hypothetical protein
MPRRIRNEMNRVPLNKSVLARASGEMGSDMSHPLHAALGAVRL